MRPHCHHLMQKCYYLSFTIFSPCWEVHSKDTLLETPLVSLLSAQSRNLRLQRKQASFQILFPLQQIRECFNATAHLSIVSDHVHLFLSTVFNYFLHRVTKIQSPDLDPVEKEIGRINLQLTYRQKYCTMHATKNYVCHVLMVFLIKCVWVYKEIPACVSWCSNQSLTLLPFRPYNLRLPVPLPYCTQTKAVGITEQSGPTWTPFFAWT